MSRGNVFKRRWWWRSRGEKVQKVCGLRVVVRAVGIDQRTGGESWMSIVGCCEARQHGAAGDVELRRVQRC